MLSNAYFLAKFRFDTAENEPAKNLKKFANFANFADRCNFLQVGDGVGRSGAARGAEGRSDRARAGLLVSAVCCSFSAVSAPIFASKYAFVSIFQNLPDFQTEIFEIWQILQILRHLQNFC